MDSSREIDPEIAAVLETLGDFDLGSLTLDAIVAMRGQTEELAALATPVLPTRDEVLPGTDGEPPLTLRIVSPADVGASRPCIYWIHGGGYIIGTALAPEPRVDHWVETLDCVVVAVDYRLAPEHPYPAPLDDCHRGLTWVADHAAELGIDPTRIVVVGESAGGGLAAGLTLRERDGGAPIACHQVLVYPMLDDRGITPSSNVAGAPVWSREANHLGWSAYLGPDLAPGDRAVSSHAAPARADDLAGVPPTFLCVGTIDLFHDEVVDFAQRLLLAGVPTELHVYPGAPHGFLPLVGDAELSRRATADIDDALARAVRSPRSVP